MELWLELCLWRYASLKFTVKYGLGGRHLQIHLKFSREIDGRLLLTGPDTTAEIPSSSILSETSLLTESPAIAYKPQDPSVARFGLPKVWKTDYRKHLQR